MIIKGAKVSEGIKEVDWSGGKLPDKTRQEFVIETYLTGSLKPNTTLYFPVVQECEQGVSRWIEIPPDGATHSHEGKWPAPGVKLTKTLMRLLAPVLALLLLAGFVRDASAHASLASAEPRDGSRGSAGAEKGRVAFQ